MKFISNNKNQDGEKLISNNVYAKCSVMTFLASLLGIVNPVLSSFLAENIISNFNLKGIIPTVLSMVMVKGTRMYLRSRVGSRLKGSMRAPLVWLQHRISKKLWWMEPMVSNWGWVGMVLTRITGGISLQTAAFFASMITDTLNTLLSGIVFYFTRNYFLSVLTALIIPTLAVVPWFASKSLRYRRFNRVFHAR
ncbi:MAG TPA: hypothetical protein VHO66_08415 [Ruminiclostridium sp.]|nr:hypothetical protein [Ruminiclostridium sp.]